MRLGQLSRKLGVSTGEIVRFLASSSISINEDSNTKIADEHAHLVTKEYAPQLLEVIAKSISEEQEEVEQAEVTLEPVDTKKFELPEATEQPILPEVIKAPKIELSGLKVLGKIEIPEKKKKETVADDSTAENENDKQPRSSRSVAREYVDRPRKNPVTLHREREEREVERRRKEKLAKEKEKKTYNYLSKVKAQAPIKKLKKLEELVEVAEEPVEKLPTTWWGKFMRWLNT